MPGLIIIVHGPPGTGKIFWLIYLLIPLLAFIDAKPKSVNQVAVVGPTNRVVDYIAEVFQNVLNDRFVDNHFIVIRCHLIGTEESLALARADLARGRPSTARPPVIDPQAGDVDLSLLGEMAAARLLADLHAAAIAQPAGVSDRRVVKPLLSLGHRMLERCGLILTPFSQSEDFASFREQYAQYECGLEFDENVMKDFRFNL
ncbi:hypothetical protein BJX70DRAFT_404899 [Aspergillus crustosus]